MKNIFILILVTISQLVSCQTIVPLKTFDIPNNAYVKDIDNTFLKYLGTWEGVLNNKKYTFEFKKITQHFIDRSIPTNSYSYFEDELVGNFKVTDLTNGQIIYNDISTSTNFEDFKIYGTHPNVQRGICTFYFTDTAQNCKNEIIFILRDTPNSNQLLYYGPRYGDYRLALCPNIDRMTIPVYLPMQDLLLTK